MFQRYARQFVSVARACVDVDAVVPNVNLIDRRVTMHNDLWVYPVVICEFMSDPQQVRLLLF